jgi:CheY-like chemotaxis protein
MSLHDLLAGKPCNGSLQGRRVLVVEDNYLVAQDLREQLLSCGAEVLGPVACVADALALLEDRPAPCGASLTSGW